MLGGLTAGFMFQDPGFRPEGAAVADEDGATVVLVGGVDRTGDEFSGAMEIGEWNDTSFAVNDEVIGTEG